MLKRFMGVALTLVLLFTTWIDLSHSHCDRSEADHHAENSVNVEPEATISSLEIESECELCCHLAASGSPLIKKRQTYPAPLVEHKTPLTTHLFERPETRPIATLVFAPKTSPPHTFKHL